jgi:hypothetical protein
MATTNVVTISEGETLTASPFRVYLVQGDTLQFLNRASEDVLVAFSESARSLLSLPVGAPQVTIAAQASVSFPVSAPEQESYCCQVVAAGTQPGHFSCPDFTGETILTILCGLGRDLSGAGQGAAGGGQQVIPQTDR